MGVNMPARTVVFDSTRKHDGNTLRDLYPGGCGTAVMHCPHYDIIICLIQENTYKWQGGLVGVALIPPEQ